MELGIFSKTYAADDVEEVFQKMEKQGLFHCQFNLASAGLSTLPETIEEEKILRIREKAGQHGIVLEALSGTFNMIDPDEEAREKGCRQFEIQCRIAEMLDIPIVTLCTGSKNPDSKWKWHDDNLKESAWNDLLRSADRILQYAEQHHVTLAVETEQSNIVCTPEKARAFLDTMSSPRLKIIMDGANLFGKEQLGDIRGVLDHAFAVLEKDIVLAHAKDMVPGEEMEFLAAGQGMMDFGYYIRLLRKYDYQGALIMHGLSEEDVPGSMQFLRGVM